MGFSTNSGAIFSKDGKERFVLWRFWDSSKPYVLFIGLNPSNADDTYNDPTTKRIIAHSKRLGYGGCFLMNCFTRIATKPDHLTPSGNWKQNCKWLDEVVPRCTEVVFAWGQNNLVQQLARDRYFKKRFPFAKCLGRNLSGSPKHPLYLPYRGALIPFEK